MQGSAPHIVEDIYSQLGQVAPRAHSEYVSKYNKLIFNISLLHYEERGRLDYRYYNALFELGEYGALLLKIDKGIEDLILHNVKEIDGEDAYERLIFIKAAALYQKEHILETQRVLKELVKMYPTNTVYRVLFEKSEIKKAKKPLLRTRALAILIFLLSAFASAVEIFIVKPFLPEYIELSMTGRNLVFAFGLLVLILPEVIVRCRAHIQSQKL